MATKIYISGKISGIEVEKAQISIYNEDCLQALKAMCC